jgi:endonuclease YncB( thermonuclease family)
MTKARLVVLLLLIPIFPQAQADTLTGRVVRVTDGDTIVVLDASIVQHKIRLTGIDAPERSQAFGTKSKEHLSDLVAGKSVVVDYNKYDRYHRILGKVLMNGEDVNLEQLEAGLAWHYKKYQGEQSSSERVKYSDAELEARRHKLGLWHDPNPMPPWEYRQAKREQMNDLKSLVGKSTVRGSQ